MTKPGSETSEEDLPAKKVVYTVHGTWPSGIFKHLAWRARVKAARPGPDPQTLRIHPTVLDPRFWFNRNSDFFKGAGGDRERIKWVPFLWSGDNSFSARHTAGLALGITLERSMSDNPEVEHVVIAHSHGGSVAIIAARWLSETDRLRLTIIAMASPFAQPITFHQRIGLLSKFLNFRLAVMSLWIVPLILLTWWAVNSYWDLQHIPFGPVLTASPRWLLWGIYVAILGDLKRFRNRRIFGKSTEEAVNNLVSRLPARLFLFSLSDEPINVRLYAIRAPGDEASLAISASQFFSLIAETLCVRVPELISNFTTKALQGHRGLWLFAICFLLAVSGFFYLDFHATGDPFSSIKEAPWWVSLIMLVICAIVGAAPQVMLERYSIGLFALISVCILIPSQLILALALGSELVTYLGLLDAECEPIPTGFLATVRTIRSKKRDEAGMVHGVHRLPEVREMIANLI